jgi:hypothetical protein
MKRLPLLFMLLCGLALSNAEAQTSIERLHDQNLHAWFVYAGDHPVAARWGVHLEGQWRRGYGGFRPQQLLLRPAINFHLSPSVMLSAGYAYARTHRYGEYPVDMAFPEHRIYQQASIQHKAGPLELTHRFRTEQRWLRQRALSTFGDLTDFSWRYQNRFRYMIRFVAPLKTTDWSLAFSNELFLNYAPRHGARTFDQNRLYAGIGRRIARDTRLEAGYMLQTLLQRNARVLELNHTIQVSITSRLPFRREAANGR